MPDHENGSGGSGSSSGQLLGCTFANSTSYNFTLSIEPTTEALLVIGEFFYNDERENGYLQSTDVSFVSAPELFVIALDITDGLVTLVYYPANMVTETITILVHPPDQSSDLCRSQELTVNITTYFETTPPECATSIYNLSASLFDSISETLRQLECNTTAPLGFEYVIDGSGLTGINTFQDVFLPTFAEHFSTGTYTLEITVCNRAYGDCNETPVIVELTVTSYPHRLFPFGHSYSQNAIEYADDFATSVYSYNGIPYWSGYYNRVYVSLPTFYFSLNLLTLMNITT